MAYEDLGRSAQIFDTSISAGTDKNLIDLDICYFSARLEIHIRQSILSGHAFNRIFHGLGIRDLAIDRGHPTLSAQADGLHPAVLQLIDITVRAAHAHGKWVGVCGELAADPLAVPVLVGLGVDELSVSARSIPEVKARVRELSLPEAQALAQAALAVGSGDEVRALVEAL